MLTGGRVLLGAGVGMMQEEFEALDAPFEARGRVTDEYIQVMRSLWAADEPTFEGEFYRIPPGLRFLPKPVRGTIPIWIGGNTMRALKRAARLGDGWLAVYQTHEEIASKRLRLRDLTEEAGRDPDSVTLAHQMRFFINEENYPEAPPGVGSVRKVADDIKRFEELGVQHLELAPPPGPTTEAIVVQMRRFAAAPDWVSVNLSGHEPEKETQPRVGSGLYRPVVRTRSRPALGPSNPAGS